MMTHAAEQGGGNRLIAFFWRNTADTLAERTRRRVTLYLIPFLFFLYILAYLDRVNVSVAGLDMAKSPADGGVGFSEYTIGFGFGIFFWGYWILEIPSTVTVVRWGARWVFVRILVLWGICAALAGSIGTPFAAWLFSWLPTLSEHTAFGNWFDGLVHLGVFSGTAGFINGLHDAPENQFYVFRFMLGFFEGGFFPSVIVYLGLWFRPEDRAKAIAAFMAAIPLANVLGQPLSSLILGVQWLGLAGWRWVFILEGLAPIVAGFATLFFLPDRPARASWLTGEERNWLEAELDREHKRKQGHGPGAWVHHLGLVLLLTAVYFCLNATSYGLGAFMPKIFLQQLGLEAKQSYGILTGSQIAGLAASPVYILALIGMLLNGRHSDHTGERVWHVAVPLTLWSVGLFLAAAFAQTPLVPLLILTLVVGTFMYAHLPAFWPIPTMFLGATAAAAAIGFINMIGNLGGSAGPWLFGWILDRTHSLALAILSVAAWPVVGAAIILIVGYTRRRLPAPSGATALQRNDVAVGKADDPPAPVPSQN